jgi:hypothetical protein
LAIRPLNCIKLNLKTLLAVNVQRWVSADPDDLIVIFQVVHKGHYYGGEIRIAPQDQNMPNIRQQNDYLIGACNRLIKELLVGKE